MPLHKWFARSNCNSLQQQWNYFWKSLQKTKNLCSECYKQLQTSVTMPTFVTEHTSTGVSCQRIHRQLRFVKYRRLNLVNFLIVICLWDQAVVLSEKPPIAGENAGLSPGLLDELMYQIGTLASVYHKPPETFIAGRKYGADSVSKTIAK